MLTELKAPPGKFRVVGLDLKNSKDFRVKDCNSLREAVCLTDRHNMTDAVLTEVYYIYDDKGVYHPGLVKVNRDSKDRSSEKRQRQYVTELHGFKEASL